MDIVFQNLGIGFERIDRVAFSIFGFDIYKYGMIICIGAVLGILLCVAEAKRTKQSPDLYIDFAFIALISGLVGARSYYLIFHDGSLADFFKIRDGGLAIYGGIIGGLAAAVVYTRIKKVSLLKFLDTVVMGLIVGQICGRWGNFFNMEAFGSATNSLFAMSMKAEKVIGLNIKGSEAIYNGAVYPINIIDGISYISVHPTFLYESVWNLILLVFIFIMRKHSKFDGMLVGIYLVGYGFGRFFIESLRTDQLKIMGVPVSMIVSAGIFVVGVCLLVIKSILAKRDNHCQIG